MKNNVIYVDFKKKVRIDATKVVLTVGELHDISQRITEIENSFDLCGPNDEDVVINLENELSSLVRKLEKSIDEVG